MNAADSSALLGKANLWIAELRERGLIDEAAAARLNETLAESFGERLDQQDDPLLTVMLCGPTAVGKSTLINALAGASIAVSGLGATTRAAMLYVHERDDPARLFEYSHALGRRDRQETEIVRHNRDALLHKVLVDTPDIDSVRLEHKELTARLVHAADLVLFVTSPEKYKVMRSARWVLQQRQQRAIAFVLNKWDRETLGLQRDRRQELIADFRNVLAEDGFPDAVIFRVSSLGGPDDEMENELPALRSWLESGITQSTASMIRQRRLRAAWGRLGAAIAGAAPEALSGHPALAGVGGRLVDGGAAAEQRVGADAAILEPVGLEDNGWPATPGLLGMWSRTRQRLASTSGALRMGLSMFSLARSAIAAGDGETRSGAGVAFGASGEAVLGEAVSRAIGDAAGSRLSMGPVPGAWLAETERAGRELGRVPADVASELAAAVNRPTFRRIAGIAGIYVIEALIVLVLLIAVGRIGLDFIAGTYAPVSLLVTVAELVALLLFIGNIVANVFFPPLRQRMRRIVAQRSKAVVRTALRQLQAVLREHVEAVDRLAREGHELLESIDRAVMAISVAGNGASGEAETVGRLFGYPEQADADGGMGDQPTLATAEERGARSLGPDDHSWQGESRALARRPRFD
jgi:energy-coupling factor transporter ATP-binding protein EcfA2